MNAEISRFWDWAQSQGCTMADLRVEGRSFFTREFLSAGSTVFTVPFSVLMHMNAAFADKTLGEVYKRLSAAGASERIVSLTTVKQDLRMISYTTVFPFSMTALSQCVLTHKVWSRFMLAFICFVCFNTPSIRTLTLFVAVEKAKGEDSFWFPYLSSLPETFNTPLWFESDELDIIRGTKVAASLSKDRAGFNQLVNFWAPRLLSAPVITNKDSTDDFIARVLRTASQESSLLWARTIVLSRGFTLLLEGKHKVTLVPLFDLLDHSPSARVEWITNDAEREAKFISASDLQGGAEIYNNYGQKANDELLQGYGFCLYPNPADVYYVRIGISPPQGKPDNCATATEDEGASGSRDRQELMWRMNTSAEFALSLKYPLPEALLHTARVCLLSDSDVYSTIGIGWSAGSGAAHLEISSTEFQAIGNLRQLLLTSVAQFGGGLDIQTDRKLLSRGHQSGENNITDNARFAMMYRLGQKEIIQSTLEALGDRAASSLDAWREQTVSTCSGATPEIVLEPSDGNSDPYQKWLDDNGVTSCYISDRLIRVGGQPCLHLRTQCVAGDILASVPSQLLLLVPGGVPSDFQRLADPLTDLVKNLEASCALRLLLVLEFGKGEDSLWAPYIKRLADHIEVPDYYKDEMLELIEGTNLVEELNNRIQRLQDEFGMVLKLLQDEHHQQVSSQTFTLERWVWADTVVEKCALLVNFEEQNRSSRGPLRRLVLAPLLSSVPSVLNGAVVECVVEDQSGSLFIRALSAMKAGALPHFFQNGLDNESRILQFAAETVVLDSEHDFVEICVGSSPEDPFSDLKDKLVQASGLGTVQYLKRRPNSGLVLACIALHSLDSDKDFEKCGAFNLLKLVSEAKSAAARGEESWCAPTGEDVGSYEHLDKHRQQAKAAHAAAGSAAVEFVRDLQSTSRARRAASTFRKLLQSVLKGMPGNSADDDRDLYLKSAGAACSLRAMLAYRHGQKKILEVWLRHLKQVIKEQTNGSSIKRKRC